MTASEALKAQFQLRIYEECIPRIIKSMSLLTTDQIWHAPNSQANSIGHLVLHLCGNVTQWIGSGIGDRADDRLRDLEFSNEEMYSQEDLALRLERLKVITTTALIKVNDTTLLQVCEVQGFKETYLSIIVHVIEHFSYHTGQIAIITKYLTGADLGFYSDLDLNLKSD